MHNNSEITGRFLLTMKDGEVLEMELNGIVMAHGGSSKPEHNVIGYKSHTLFSSKSKQKIDSLWDYMIETVWSKENIDRIAKGEKIPVEIPQHLLEGVKKHNIYKRV